MLGSPPVLGVLGGRWMSRMRCDALGLVWIVLRGAAKRERRVRYVRRAHVTVTEMGVAGQV